MIKVLFVCLGNICRSTMAEYVFKDMVIKDNIQDKFFIDSAGTSNEAVGEPIYYDTRKKLNEMNIECGNHIARKMTKEDYEKFDYIIGMEERNIINIKRIVGEDTQNKIYKLLEFSENERDIADPWYTGNFDRTFDDIVEGLTYFIEFLSKNSKI